MNFPVHKEKGKMHKSVLFFVKILAPGIIETSIREIVKKKNDLINIKIKFVRLLHTLKKLLI